MIPSVPYPGGKGRWGRDIVENLPEGRFYFEPFAGRGNIFFAAATLYPHLFKEWHLNDIRQAPFFEALRKHGHHVTVPFDLRAAYYRLWKNNPQTPLGILMEPIVTRDGGGYGTGGPAGEHHASIEQYQESLIRCHDLIRRLKPTITALDWKKLHLEQLGPDCVGVFDPPYYGADVRPYTSVGFDYDALVKLLMRARFKWIFMEYNRPLYIRAFGQPFFTKTVGYGSGNKSGQKVECMWKNF
jgi:hypothetical protein